MKKNLFLTVPFMAVALASCESNEPVSEMNLLREEGTTYKETVEMYADTLKARGLYESELFFRDASFMTLGEQLDYEASQNVSRGLILEPDNPGDPMLAELIRIRFSFTPGITIGFLKCFTKIPLCGFEIIIELGSQAPISPDSPYDMYVKVDEDGREYVDLLFSELPEEYDEVPNVTISEAMTEEVYIPEDIREEVQQIELSTKQTLPVRYTLPAGEYQYDSTLGELGGYRLYLTPVKAFHQL